jgi:hypothetical protein
MMKQTKSIKSLAIQQMQIYRLKTTRFTITKKRSYRQTQNLIKEKLGPINRKATQNVWITRKEQLKQPKVTTKLAKVKPK